MLIHPQPATQAAIEPLREHREPNGTNGEDIVD